MVMEGRIVMVLAELIRRTNVKQEATMTAAMVEKMAVVVTIAEMHQIEMEQEEQEMKNAATADVVMAKTGRAAVTVADIAVAEGIMVGAANVV